jgi:hypothetical protein
VRVNDVLKRSTYPKKLRDLEPVSYDPYDPSQHERRRSCNRREKMMTHVIRKDELPYSTIAHKFEGYRYGDVDVPFVLTLCRNATPRAA